MQQYNTFEQLEVLNKKLEGYLDEDLKECKYYFELHEVGSSYPFLEYFNNLVFLLETKEDLHIIKKNKLIFCNLLENKKFLDITMSEETHDTVYFVPIELCKKKYLRWAKEHLERFGNE
jgi:hypothetical protein